MAKDLLITIGEFVLNKDSKILYKKDGEETQLHSTLYKLLLCFVERSNQTLSKQEILDVVWEGKTVSEANVNQNIRKLRDALGDSASSPLYIETIPGEGYRFIANSEDFKATPFKSSRNLFIVATLIFAITVGLITSWMMRETPRAANKFTSISSLKGAELSPFATDDGKFIVFSVVVEGVVKNYIKEDGSENYHWLKQDSEILDFPEISPDGSKLMLFQNDANYCGITIQSIELKHFFLGPRINTLTCPNENSRMKAIWVSDSMIAVSINDTLQEPANIILYNLVDSSIELIGKKNKVGFGDYNFSFSKLNRQLLYLRNLNMSETDIWLYGLDTRIHTKVISVPFLLSDIDWNKDGKSFFYKSGYKTISQYFIEERASKVVVESEMSVKSPFMIGESQLGLRLGEYVVSDIEKIAGENHEREILVESTYNDYDGVETDKYLMFVSDRSGFNQIWRKNKETNKLIQLTHFEEASRINGLDASRNSIAFTSSSNVYVIDTDGNSVFSTKQLDGQDNYNNPSLSKNGDRLLMTKANDGSPEILFVALDESKAIQSIAKGVSSHWADEGGYFIKYDDKHIYRFDKNFRAERLKHVMLDSPISQNSDWTVVNDVLMFLSGRKDLKNIQTIDLRTKKRSEIINSRALSFWVNKRNSEVILNRATVNDNRLVKTKLSD